MINNPNWILVESWATIEAHLRKEFPCAFLVSCLSLQRLGAPIIESYQTGLSVYPQCSLTVECGTPSQALKCMYHGIKNVLYTGVRNSAPLKSIAEKTSTQFIESSKRG